MLPNDYLDDYYKEHGRLDYHNGAKGRFWDKVHEIVDILETADTWPFEPVCISKDAKVLYDGHHRCNAALLAGWDKPIPFTAYPF